MSKKNKKGLDTRVFTDRWSAVKAQLETLASEQVSADIELVEAQKALKLAELANKKAIARKTLAEQRLASVRNNLGAGE